MKKLLTATSLLLAAASGAQAEANLVLCQITMLQNNTEVAYFLRRSFSGVFEEITFTKNGNRLIHPADSRPVWISEVRGGVFSVYYGKDARYALRTLNDVSVDGDNFGATAAVLTRDDVTIGVGRCGGEFD